MNNKVRLATQDDISKLVDVYSEWKKFKGILPDQLIEVNNSKDLEKHFNNPHPTRLYLLVIDEDNDPLGACYIDISLSKLSSIRIGDMIVKESNRRQGVGSLLVNEVIEYAEKNNIKKIWLWSQEELTPAIKFYESMGFVVEGRQEKQFCSKDALLLGFLV